MSEEDEQKAPFDPDEGDDSPVGDTDEHSDAEEGAPADAYRRPATHHVGNALGGEGEGSSAGGAPRRHVKRTTTPLRV